jgi:hypothetical protein
MTSRINIAHRRARRAAAPLAFPGLFVMLASLAACSASVGTSSWVSVPADAASTCAQHCASIGGVLDSVVIMASSVGCVCKPSNAPASRAAASGAGGVTALMMQEQARQSQQASYRR